MTASGERQMNPAPRIKRRPISAAAWRPLALWLEQPARSDAAGAPELVVEALRAGAIPGLLSPIRIEAAAIGFFLRKPGGGLSEREIDVEGAALIALLVLAGGSLRLEPHGDDGGWFYGRLYIGAGNKRRAYVSRVIAGTDQGIQTREGPDFHSWCRGSFSLRTRTTRDTSGKHGVETAKQYARECFAEVMRQAPDKLPAGLTAERYSDLLDFAHRLMSRLPLAAVKSQGIGQQGGGSQHRKETAR